MDELTGKPGRRRHDAPGTVHVVCPKCTAKLHFNPDDLSFREMTGVTFVEYERYRSEVLEYLTKETAPELFARAEMAHANGCGSRRIAKILECSVEDAMIWMQSRA